LFTIDQLSVLQSFIMRDEIQRADAQTGTGVPLPHLWS